MGRAAGDGARGGVALVAGGVGFMDGDGRRWGAGCVGAGGADSVDAQGYRLTRIRALTRYAFSWIWGLPLLLQLTPWPLAVTHLSIVLGVWVVLWMLASRLHPQGQFWHDAWAKTQLLQAP